MFEIAELFLQSRHSYYMILYLHIPCLKEVQTVISATYLCQYIVYFLIQLIEASLYGRA